MTYIPLEINTYNTQFPQLPEIITYAKSTFLYRLWLFSV